MALNDDEKAKVRRYLGYFNTGTAASIMLGVPRPAQPLFLVDMAMDLLLPPAEPRIRQILSIIDGTEQRLITAQKRLSATQLGELHLRDNEPDLLRKERKWWIKLLADELGVPMNSYSEGLGTAGGGSIPIRLS